MDGGPGFPAWLRDRPTALLCVSHGVLLLLAGPLLVLRYQTNRHVLVWTSSHTTVGSLSVRVCLSLGLVVSSSMFSPLFVCDSF